jgi:hypothetical protein
MDAAFELRWIGDHFGDGAEGTGDCKDTIELMIEARMLAKWQPIIGKVGECSALIGAFPAMVYLEEDSFVDQPLVRAPDSGELGSIESGERQNDAKHR